MICNEKQCSMFISEKNNPYPLCDNPQCKDSKICCISAHMDEEPYWGGQRMTIDFSREEIDDTMDALLYYDVVRLKRDKDAPETPFTKLYYKLRNALILEDIE